MTIIQIIALVYSILALLAGIVLWYEVVHAIQLGPKDPFYNDEINDK